MLTQTDTQCGLDRQTKVCIIAEGCYPIFRGGLSEWAHELIKQLNFTNFDIFCIAPPGPKRQLYDGLPNVGRVVISEVTASTTRREKSALPKAISKELSGCLASVLYGSALDCERLAELSEGHHITKAWLHSKEYWDTTTQFYQENCPDRDFRDFYWTTQGIYSMLLDGLALVDKVPVADVYHSLAPGLGGLVGSMAKVLHRRPLVLSELGQYMRERAIELSRSGIPEAAQRQIVKLSETLLRTSFKYADSIQPCSSSYIAQELELGADRSRIRTISNGIDCDRFRPNSSRNGAPPLVGCFARIVPVKDQLTFIRACKKVLERHQANFVIIGEVQDAEYYHQCQALVQELELTDNISFVGYVDKVLDWYHKVNIFVLPSLWEGIPLALLEAMSCGLPCVCTAVGGVPDVLCDPSVGYMVPPSDADSLASRISQLLESGTLRAEMGMRARELVEEKYTIQHMAEQVLDTYWDLLASRQLLETHLEVLPDGRPIG
jgi:glycosyltransferase involved in cell wall biosynthesis